nr:transporter [uncultured Alistipes sp.]
MVDYLNHVILQQFKNWMLPIAMIVGGVFYPFVSSLSFLTPYLIFLMLLVPYCKLSFDDMRITRLHVILLGIQILGSLALFGIIALFDPLLAQGTFICVMAPTATSAAVITGMLGGNIAVLATYTLLSNLTVATLSPLVFSLIGSQTALPFFESFGIVCRQMIPLLILPFVIAVLLKRFAPRIHRQLRERQQISFYLWAVALTIVMGNTVAFLVKQDASNYANEIWMALLALAVCCAQFLTGRRIGRRYRNKIAGAQGLGQKNTILAIWMAQTYLTPIASVGPAAYVIWQNLINSYQLWAKRHREQVLPKKEPVKTPIGLPGTPVIHPQR